VRPEVRDEIKRGLCVTTKKLHKIATVEQSFAAALSAHNPPHLLNYGKDAVAMQHGRRAADLDPAPKFCLAGASFFH
jgi:hypothetical protein